MPVVVVFQIVVFVQFSVTTHHLIVTRFFKKNHCQNQLSLVSLCPQGVGPKHNGRHPVSSTCSWRRVGSAQCADAEGSWPDKASGGHLGCPPHLNVPHSTVPCYPSLECRPAVVFPHWSFTVQSHKPPILFVSVRPVGWTTSHWRYLRCWQLSELPVYCWWNCSDF